MTLYSVQLVFPEAHPPHLYTPTETVISVFLTQQDYRWWWRTFLVSGGSAFYVLIYAIFYFVNKVLCYFPGFKDKILIALDLVLSLSCPTQTGVTGMFLVGVGVCGSNKCVYTVGKCNLNVQLLCNTYLHMDLCRISNNGLVQF